MGRWNLPQAWEAMQSNDLAVRADASIRYPYITSATDDELINSLKDVPASRIEKRLKAKAKQEQSHSAKDGVICTTLTDVVAPELPIPQVAASPKKVQPKQKPAKDVATPSKGDDDFGDLFSGDDEEGEDEDE